MALRMHRTSYITPEQYLVLERKAEVKSEYWGGQVYAMAGASRAHNSIVVNVITSLNMQLKGRPCMVFPSDMRTKVLATGLYTYPDVSALCGVARFEDKYDDILLNPVVVVEVLSPSTEAYDRGTKFAHYRTIDSLTDYLLIAQDHPTVEHFMRQPDDGWLLNTYQGLDAVAVIASIECTLPLTDIFDKVEWPGGATPTPSLRVIREEDLFYSDDDPQWQTARRDS